MIEFLKKDIISGKFELLIDTKIFPKEIVLKAAYNFLDKGYFFFKLNGEDNLILQFTKKDGISATPESIIGDYSDELLNVYLRDTLEKDNKNIREAIISKAINSAIDIRNFVSIDTDRKQNPNQIDFDKDIDEILREIENDPDLKIDEDEIERILREIEAESSQEAVQVKKIVLDPKNAKDAKKRFSSGK